MTDSAWGKEENRPLGGGVWSPQCPWQERTQKRVCRSVCCHQSVHTCVPGIWLGEEESNCEKAELKTPKDFLCNISLCWCVVFCVSVFLAHHWSPQHYWCHWASCFSTGISLNKLAIFTLILREKQRLFFPYGLTCMIPLSLLATATLTREGAI